MLISISTGVLGMAICAAISVLGLSAILIKFAANKKQKNKATKSEQREEDYDL